MNFFKRLASLLTGNNPSQTERGAHTPRVPCSASPPNTSSSPPASGWGAAARHAVREPSSLDELGYNRNGKIAHLPRALRDRINLALYHRCPAKDLARALNQLPEVKSVMAQYFNGRALKSQNIYEWKHGGYRDWLHHRQLLEQKRELTADAKDLAGTANGLPDSLFGILTLDYADLMMKGDSQSPEEFEKRRKKLSLVSQDIVRIRRSDLQARRVQVQETRLERDEEKTEEQLVFKFMEWAENPAIRRALILAPMEANRQTRLHFGVPPRPEDPLVEQLTRNDPSFHPPVKKTAKTKPNPTEKSNPEAETVNQPTAEKGGASVPASRPDNKSDAQDQKDLVGTGSCPSAADPQVSPVTSYGDKSTSQLATEIEENHNRAKSSSTNPSSIASEKAPVSINDTNQPIVEEGGASVLASRPDKTSEVQEQKDTVGTRCCASEADPQVSPATTSTLRPSTPSPRPTGQNPQNSPLPKPQHLSDYERALLEGKTFLEALYAQSTPAPAKAPAPQGKNQPSHPKPNPLDTFSQPADPPSSYPSLRLINFRPESRWKTWG
jgi:hypothetical protein